MTNAGRQLKELLNIKNSKTWKDFRFYKDSEREDKPVLSIERELDEDGWTDVESSFIHEISNTFQAEGYEITVCTCENPRELSIQFYGVEVAAEAVVE